MRRLWASRPLAGWGCWSVSLVELSSLKSRGEAGGCALFSLLQYKWPQPQATWKKRTSMGRCSNPHWPPGGTKVIGLALCLWLSDSSQSGCPGPLLGLLSPMAGSCRLVDSGMRINNFLGKNKIQKGWTLRNYWIYWSLFSNTNLMLMLCKSRLILGKKESSLYPALVKA